MPDAVDVLKSNRCNLYRSYVSTGGLLATLMNELAGYDATAKAHQERRESTEAKPDDRALANAAGDVAAGLRELIVRVEKARQSVNGSQDAWR
jgi:hypothetical protein